jgi:alpha-beta hydrolase superfamily lysophospholipase
MPHSTETLKGRDGTPVVLHRWTPDGPVRGVVVLAHGMGEHAPRYDHLATTLNDAGFLVQGPDHRGHGATAGAVEKLGIVPGGWEAVVDDIDMIIDGTHDEFPDQPVVLLGHSMGSFVAQQYLAAHSDKLTALALSGTASVDPLLEALDLSGPVDLSAFNAPFAPARTDFDWLSRDEAQVDAYIADDYCGFGLPGDDAKKMFAASAALADPANLAGVRTSLPVYITVGDMDPVNGQLALLNLLTGRLDAAGLTDVTVTVWPQARHEVFNETNRAEVEADLLAWLNRVIPE